MCVCVYAHVYVRAVLSVLRQDNASINCLNLVQLGVVLIQFLGLL